MQIEDLLFLLRDIRVTPEEDSVLWKGGDSDRFRIRGAYNLLAAPIPLVFPGKNIWVDEVPTKVVRTLWDIAFALFGVQWVFPEKVKEACSVGGALLWVKKGRRYGRPFRYVFFGRCGRKEIG